MSKYYKAEDVINALADQWHYEATMEYPDTAGDIEEWKQNARELFADLPTIEVSEDAISREGLSDKVGRYYAERGDFGSFECSWILNAIKNAPSAVPSRAEGEWQTHGSHCKCSLCGNARELFADLPTIEASEDAISREQFREQMYHRCFEVDNDPNMQKWDSGNWLRWKLFEEELENAPSVVPKRSCYRCGLREDCEDSTERKPKEGEWVRNFDGNEWYWYCTNCKTQWYEDDLWMGGNEFPKYCPDCGAKMKGEEDRMWTPQTDCDNCAESGSYKCTKCDGEMYYKTDIPQTGCDTCKHYKLTCDLFSEICKYEPITQAETQNSNLTFEKAMEEIQTQTIEFPDTHQKFTFARKIEMDGDSIKIGDWEYKGVKDAERFVKGSEQTERSSE